MRYETMQGWIEVYETTDDAGDAIRVMDSEGAFQSATYLGEARYGLAFDYHRAYNALFEALEPRRVLMLGGGGYAYPKHVVRTHPGVHVDVVEIDPAIEAIARRSFFIDELVGWLEARGEADRLGLFVADAREFVERQNAEGAEPYDAVVNDCFRGRSPVMTLASVEAVRAIKARLAPGGLYLTNVISALEGDESYYLHSMVLTLREAFADVQVVPCNPGEPEERANNVVIACDERHAFAGAVDIEPGEASRVFTDDLSAMYEDLFWVEDAD